MDGCCCDYPTSFCCEFAPVGGFVCLPQHWSVRGPDGGPVDERVTRLKLVGFLGGGWLVRTGPDTWQHEPPSLAEWMQQWHLDLCASLGIPARVFHPPEDDAPEEPRQALTAEQLAELLGGAASVEQARFTSEGGFSLN